MVALITNDFCKYILIMTSGFEVIISAPGIDRRTINLEEGGNLVGRWDPEAKSYPEIDLTELDPDSKVSRKHALLTLAKSGVVLEDLGSRNGTFLRDGSRLDPGTQYPIKDGEEFVVGKVTLRLRVRT